MTADELRQEFAKVDPSEWGTIAGAVLPDILEAIERADERFRAQAETIERQTAALVRADEEAANHCKTIERLEARVKALADQVVWLSAEPDPPAKAREDQPRLMSSGGPERKPWSE